MVGQPLNRRAIGTMGERLVTIRMPAPDPIAQAKMALAGHRSGSGDQMRAELKAAMEQVLDFASAQPAPAMSPETVQWLAELATFGVRMRSPVDRDPTNRYEISTIPEPEHPPRLAIALRQIWEAMHRIGCTTAEAENGVEQIVRNSIPPDRLIVFRFPRPRDPPGKDRGRRKAGLGIFFHGSEAPRRLGSSQRRRQIRR